MHDRTQVLSKDHEIHTRRIPRHAVNQVPITDKLALVHGNTHYVTLVDVTQTLMCFDDLSSLREAESVTSMELVNAERPSPANCSC